MPEVVKADPSQASGFRKAVPSAAPVLLVLCWVVSWFAFVFSVCNVRPTLKQ